MSERLRVADILDNNIRSTGGTEKSTHNLLQFKSLEGLLITPYPVPQLPYRAYSNEKMIQIPFTRQHIPAPRELEKTIDHLNEFDPRIILLNTPTLYTATIYWALPQELKDRCVALWRLIIDAPLYESRHDSLNHLVHAYIQRPGIRKLQVAIANSVPLNIAISKSVATSLHRNGVKQPITVVPTQVGRDFSAEKRFNNGPDFREKFLSPDQLGILTVGRIAPEKGLEWVTELYSELQQLFPTPLENDSFSRVKITVAGGAKPQHERFFHSLLNRTNGRTNTNNAVELHWIGDQSHTQLEDLYNAYDICFMPSPDEPFGRVPVEAMSAGSTVIGRNGSQSTREILSEPYYPIGILVESPYEAAQQILSLMHFPDKLAQLQTNALYWARSHFTLETAEQLLIAALEPVLRNTSADSAPNSAPETVPSLT
ncbi:MAG: glycosyltransferase [Patescibacteria group bacterium]